MLAFVIRRILQAAAVVLAVSAVVFVGLYGIGDPALLLVDPDAPTQERERAVRMLGLDRPLSEQYLSFLGQCAARRSRHARSSTTSRRSQLILVRDAGDTGAGVRRHADRDCSRHSARAVGGAQGGTAGGPGDHGRLDPRASACRASGSGMMLIMVFSVMLGWLPSNGRGQTGTHPRHRTGVAHLGRHPPPDPAGDQSRAVQDWRCCIRLTRAGAREALVLDYVKFARAKGLSERARHRGACAQVTS